MRRRRSGRRRPDPKRTDDSPFGRADRDAASVGISESFADAAPEFERYADSRSNGNTER